MAITSVLFAVSCFLITCANAFYERGSNVIQLKSQKDLDKIDNSPYVWMIGA